MKSGESREVQEQLIVLRAQLGESGAYDQLFGLYHSKLRYYLRRLLRTDAEADDVAQDVWMTVIRRIDSLEQPAAFRGWLFRIAHNRAMSRMRRLRREFVLLESDDALASVPDGAQEVEFRDEDIAHMHEALETLTAAHREVLTLQFLVGMRYEEIAEAVGCNVGTVRSRIHYGKRALRDAIEVLRTRRHGSRKRKS